MFYVALLLSICVVQESNTRLLAGHSGDKIVREARVVTISDALKMKGPKSEMVKLATVYVEQLEPNKNTNAVTPNADDKHAPQLIACKRT